MTIKAITPGQIASLRTFLVDLSEDPACHVYIASALIGRPLVSLEALTQADWRFLRDRCYPHWPEGDWSPERGAFYSRCAELRNQYLEELIGQRRLF